MSEELTKKVIQIIADTQRMPVDKITPDSTFQELGIDSLDGINILFALENEFNINIPDDAAQTIRSVREMTEGVQKLIDDAAGATAAR